MSVCHLSDATCGDIFVSDFKKYSLLFDVASDHRCCQQSSTVIPLHVLSAVENTGQPSSGLHKIPSPNRNMLLTLIIHCVYNVKVEEELGQLLFTVAVVFVVIVVIIFGIVVGTVVCLCCCRCISIRMPDAGLKCLIKTSP